MRRLLHALAACLTLIAAPAGASICQAYVEGLPDIRVVALATATDGPRPAWAAPVATDGPRAVRARAGLTDPSHAVRPLGTATDVPRAVRAEVAGATAPHAVRAGAAGATAPRAEVARATATDAPRAVQGVEGVAITYLAHSAFRIETAAGVTIVTDYFGTHGGPGLPQVVTMNRGHITHYTPSPDPGIAHVLRGWDPGGGVAAHQLTVGDVTIRNVVTDLRSAPGANSIFVFEVADLCIGHLGHLHHPLTEAHYAALGRLDIVMVPVDGAVTLATAEVIALMRRLKSRLVLPMHAFGPGSLARFLDGMATEFAIERGQTPTLAVSLATLPARPTVLVLPAARTDPSFAD